MDAASLLPRHIAVIMDGNGRWAKQRLLPRIAGHKAGVKSVRRIITRCAELKIEALTLFAFSTENWQRPAEEVNYLMNLFITMLKREVKKLHKENIRLRILGDRSRFNETLQQLMNQSEQLTAKNSGLTLNIAANYGGRWEICEAFRRIAYQVEINELKSTDVSAELIQKTLSDLPNPELLIRTSGEQRISNFLLWQMADAQLYFTEVFWPDFDEKEFEKALGFFAKKLKMEIANKQLQVYP